MSAVPPRRLLLLLPALALGFLGVAAVLGPVTSTETRYCEMGREMLASGDWVVPRFNGAPLLEKPPFEYWSTASSLAAFGVNDVAPHVVHLLAGAIVLWLVGRIARRFAPEGPAEGRGRGRFALLSLATMPSFAIQAYAVSTDIWLVLSTTVAGWALLEADRAEGPARRRWALLLHAALGFGMLVKGPLTLALVGLPAVAAALVRRDAQILRPFASLPGLALLAAVSVPWYWAANERIPGLLSEFVNHRLLGGLGSSEGLPHRHGIWTVWVPLFGCMPWLAALPAAVAAIARRGRFKRGEGLPLLLLALAAPVLFTFTKTRLVSYTSPAFPWLALLVAIGAPAAGEEDVAPARRGVLGFLAPSWGRGVAQGAAGMAVAAVGVAIVLAVLGEEAPAVAVSGAAALAAVLVVWRGGWRATLAVPVTRAALATALFFAAGAPAVFACPERLKAAKPLWTAFERHRGKGEPYAVLLNYDGDWGLFPWYSRGEVTFFDYPNEQMLLRPDAYRPDLFLPRERLVPWLREPGRRWLMLRPRDVDALAKDGVALTVVAEAATEYVLATNLPLAWGGAR